MADVTLRLAVECRDRSRKSDVEWIDGLIGKFANLPVDKVIAVSRRGFSAAAMSKASGSNIELRVLAECLTHEWSAEFIQLGMAAFEFKQAIGQVTVTVEPIPDSQISLESIVESAGRLTGRTLNQYLQACFLNHVATQVRGFVEAEFLAKLPPLAALNKKWEFTVPVDVNDTWIHFSDIQRCQIVKLTYLVIATSSAKPAEVKHFRYGATAMASVGTIEFDDKAHHMKVVQVAGQPQLSVNFKTEPRGDA